ncbi:hydantoinase/carbamoylase family amidase [Microbacterium koreense]|uniref:Hydantoinase/carbamoylase family amidase n=1 Tax=Microbacterium koreense TaxID=323761 RepID=A0ABW2ZMR7_9MICO
MNNARTTTSPARTDVLLRTVVDEISPIGRADDGSTSRLAYSSEERAAHDLLSRRFSDHPSKRFVVHTDAAGNRWITLLGSRPDLPAVLTGSHLDSVPEGGMWDGALGVYAGAVALLQLAERDPLPRSISLIAFASEESPRFAQSAYRFGSRAIAGRVDPADLARLADADGVTLAAAFAALGLEPDRVTEAHVPFDRIHAVLELHIDQGLLLVNAGVSVAAVSAITGSCRLRVTVHGQADHSGAARMRARRDALAAAAELVLAAEIIARADPRDDLVVTVGAIRVEPGSISVVPGLAEFSVDIRSVDADTQNAAQASLREEFDRVSAERGVRVEAVTIRDVAPITMSEQVIQTVMDVLSDQGIAPDRVPSHAGHDTGSFAGHPRLGMLFVRNISGRSHSRDEHIDWADAVRGADVLRESLARLAAETPETAHQEER